MTDHDYHDLCTDHGCWIFANDPCHACTETYRRRIECQLPPAHHARHDGQINYWIAPDPARPQHEETDMTSTNDPITAAAEQVGISRDDAYRILVAARDLGVPLRPTSPPTSTPTPRRTHDDQRRA